MGNDLETPSTSQELYFAVGDECADFKLRPLFTGDLLTLSGRWFTFVQHPCAMRSGELLPNQLVAEVAEFNTPRSWNGNFKKAFFPAIEGVDYAATFTELSLVSSEDLKVAERVAMLSLQGVNLLVQRWIYHCSRVVIPTARISEQVSGPYEEADLVEDFSRELVEQGHDAAAAQALVNEWLDADKGSLRRQVAVPQTRPHVRRQLQRLLDSQGDGIG